DDRDGIQRHAEEEGEQDQTPEVRKREPEEQRVAREVKRLEELSRDHAPSAGEQHELEAEREEHRPAVMDLETKDAGRLTAEKQGEGDAQGDAREKKHLVRQQGRRRKGNG